MQLGCQIRGLKIFKHEFGKIGQISSAVASIYGANPEEFSEIASKVQANWMQ